MKLIVSIVFTIIVFAQSLFAQNILDEGLGALSLSGTSLQSGAIRIEGTGNIHANKAIYSSETTLDEIDVTFIVQLSALDILGNFRFGIGKFASLAGTLVEFAGTSTETTIHVSKLNGSSPTQVTTYTLPFPLTVNQEYKIRIGKRVRNLHIEVTSIDEVSHYFNNELSYPNPFYGCLWGKPFIGCVAGVITVKTFSLTTPLNLKPRLAVWGDSFIEAYALPNVEGRYVSLFQNEIGEQNISIMGRGGESSVSISTRLPRESLWFKDSKYALLALGANDSNFESWKNNTLNSLAHLKSYGMIPLIVTLAPRADRASFIALANTWIRTEYDGAYVDLGLSVSADNVNWIANMNLGDGVHPSPLAHINILERFRIEAPYLFRETDAFTINYFNETTNEPVAETLEYSDKTNFSISENGNEAVIPLTTGKTLYFRNTTITPGYNSIYHILPIPERPETPAHKASSSLEEYDWNYSAGYENILDYEYSTNESASWLVCNEKPLTLPYANNLSLRVKASTENFKSNELRFDFSTSSISNNAIANIRLYPNPIINVLNINNVLEETTMELKTSDGLIIQSALLIEQTNTINTSTLNAGLYILTLKNETYSKNFKIIKL